MYDNKVVCLTIVPLTAEEGLPESAIRKVQQGWLPFGPSQDVVEVLVAMTLFETLWDDIGRGRSRR